MTSSGSDDFCTAPLVELLLPVPSRARRFVLLLVSYLLCVSLFVRERSSLYVGAVLRHV